MKVKVACILLAAGLSSRMKIGNKLLLKFNNKTIIEETVNHLAKTNIYKLFVILGHQSETLANTLKNLKIFIVINSSYKKGISSSIIEGVKMLSNNTSGVMICLADMPKITTNSYNTLINFFNKFYENKKPLIIIPEYHGKLGNPVIFSNYFFTDLKNLRGDKGAKSLINKNKKYIKIVNINNNSILEDIDNVTNYKKLLRNEE